MDWYTLAQFLAAALLVFLTPGPVMAMLAHNTSRYGVTAGFLTVIGVDLGEMCLLGATFAGLTLSSDLLPLFFRWVSLAGALYLIWLAVEAFLVRRRTSSKPDLSRCRKPILDGLTIAFANPAALLFYTAFFPQFINPERSISEQMFVLSATYVCARLARNWEVPSSISRSRPLSSLGSWRRLVDDLPAVPHTAGANVRSRYMGPSP